MRAPDGALKLIDKRELVPDKEKFAASYFGGADEKNRERETG